MVIPKVLCIEDEKGIQDALKYLLSEHFEMDFADNGAEGIKKIMRATPDLLLLDLKMPGLDGFEVCKIIREDREFDSLPIMVVSAFNSSTERTRAFELGADDYISKPFDEAELIARIHRKLNNKKNTQADTKRPMIELNITDHQAVINQMTIQFCATEFRIMQVLVERYGTVVSREEMVEIVWEKQEVSPRLLDPHILTLRQKIKKASFTIQSIYGKGYILKRE